MRGAVLRPQSWACSKAPMAVSSGCDIAPRDRPRRNRGPPSLSNGYRERDRACRLHIGSSGAVAHGSRVSIWRRCGSNGRSPFPSNRRTSARWQSVRPARSPQRWDGRCRTRWGSSGRGKWPPPIARPCCATTDASRSTADLPKRSGRKRGSWRQGSSPRCRPAKLPRRKGLTRDRRSPRADVVWPVTPHWPEGLNCASGFALP